MICYYIQDVYVIGRYTEKSAGLCAHQGNGLHKESEAQRIPQLSHGAGNHAASGKGQAVFPCGDPDPHAAMDFWASMEHQLCYKTERTDIVSLSGELTYYADMLHEMERRISVFYDCNIPVPAAETAIDSNPKVPALS